MTPTRPSSSPGTSSSLPVKKIKRKSLTLAKKMGIFEPGGDALVGIAIVPLAAKLELGPRELLMASVSAPCSGCPFLALVTVTILVLLLLLLPFFTDDGKVTAFRGVSCFSMESVRIKVITNQREQVWRRAGHGELE
ncbi:hypothetical protein E2C01_030252 [Portunus trituberculatus]|uniref:Uncharacterized protein n=1 Tax=Portunus trituberculatus TaxID=210409 RepID=A0A5B7EV70_PORTR|nr:hypothetical protein [Portunus trituberculatus]